MSSVGGVCLLNGIAPHIATLLFVAKPTTAVGKLNNTMSVLGLDNRNIDIADLVIIDTSGKKLICNKVRCGDICSNPYKYML